jgi:hypothetical protein
MKKRALAIELAQRPEGIRRNFAQVPEMPGEIPPPKRKPAAPPAAARPAPAEK